MGNNCWKDAEILLRQTTINLFKLVCVFYQELASKVHRARLHPIPNNLPLHSGDKAVALTFKWKICYVLLV